MNLILGFIPPDSGQILIDGKVLDKSNLDSWFQQIGYVRQDIFIVDGSLAENVAFGIDNAGMDLSKVNECLKKAQLTEFVNNLHNGIHTSIGERGAKISGGQRQRIGIARALYRDVKVLFFDEATSSLDSKTEREITESIKKLQSSGLTTVIIAHRESSLTNCDRVINISR